MSDAIRSKKVLEGEKPPSTTSLTETLRGDIEEPQEAAERLLSIFEDETVVTDVPMEKDDRAWLYDLWTDTSFIDTQTVREGNSRYHHFLLSVG